MISLPVDGKFYIINYTSNLTAIWLMTDTVPERYQEFKRKADAVLCCESLNKSNFYLKLAYENQGETT